jgi:hypothetical protein
MSSAGQAGTTHARTRDACRNLILNQRVAAAAALLHESPGEFCDVEPKYLLACAVTVRRFHPN